MEKWYHKSNFKTLLSLGCILVLGCLYLAIVFPNALFEANQWLSVNTGDGIKNYYTYQYSIHSGQIANFQGFNYPHGECFFFLDSHPALSAFFYRINNLFPGFDQYTIGILNLLFLFNLLLTWLFLYLILKRYVKSDWYSLFTSFGVMLLQPQIFRLGGHLSLSFSMAIPMTWFLLIKFYEGKSQVFCGVALVLSNLFWLFTHAYLGASTIVFSLLYGLTFLFMHRKEYKWYTWIFPVVFAILPGIISIGLVAVFDIHEMRPLNKWGLGVFSADFNTVFIPMMGYWHDIIAKLIPPLLRKQNWEGWAYVGLLGCITTVLLVRYVWLIARKRWMQQKKKITIQQHELYKTFTPALLTSGLLLFYAMNTDTDSKWLLWIADQIQFLKNLRSTGRFAWSFYYVITIFGASFFYIYITNKLKKHKLAQYILLCIIPLSLIIEAIPHQKCVRSDLFKSPNSFIYENLSREMQEAVSSIQPAEYQAILTVPYYYMASGYYNFPFPENGTESLSQLIAYHTELPLVSAHVGHSSLPEVKKHLQLFNIPFYKKDIEEDFPNQKPFLIFYHKEMSPKPWEEYYLAQSTLIRDFGIFELRKIDFNKMLKIDNDMIDKLSKIADEQRYSSENVSLLTQGIIYNNCDSNNCLITRNGRGAIPIIGTQERIMWTIQTNMLLPETPYELSFWAYNCGENCGENTATSWQMKIYEVTEKEKILLGENNARHSPYIVGCWSLCQLVFTPENIEHGLEIICNNYNKVDTLYFDEFLLKPIEQNVIDLLPSSTQTGKTLYYNNHFIHK